MSRVGRETLESTSLLLDYKLRYLLINTLTLKVHDQRLHELFDDPNSTKAVLWPGKTTLDNST